MKTIEFTVRMQIADDAEPTDAAMQLLTTHASDVELRNVTLIADSIEVLPAADASVDPVMARVIEVLSQSAHVCNNTIDLLRRVTPDDLPIEMLVTDRTPAMIELKPSSDRFGWVSHMLYPGEIEALVSAGVFTIKP